MFRKRIHFAILAALCVSLSLCVIFNVYGAHMLSTIYKPSTDVRSHYNKSDGSKLMERKIMQILLKLPIVYKNKNPQFFPILFDIRDGLNSTSSDKVALNYLWEQTKQWPGKESLFPMPDSQFSLVLQALKTAKIIKADNAKRGTQLKLLLTLEGNQMAIFKPRWYDKEVVLLGSVYEGHDRHNSEVLGLILAMLLNIRRSPISVVRTVHMKNDIWLNATPNLRKTMTFKGDKQICVYGDCLYCEPKYSVCADEMSGQLEGAVILLVPGTFKSHSSPWRRTYRKEQAKWENDSQYCKKVEHVLPIERILDLIDVSIFDFLLQNGDRHHYEVFEKRILLMDNGKGLGNPYVDHIDILAPLYHCCVLRNSTWDRLLLLSGSMLSYSVKTLEGYFLPESGGSLTTNLHLKALDRRILKVFATVHFCMETRGARHVFRS